MRFRAILFDLDGTLLDTLEDIGNSMNRVLAKNGFPGHGMDTYRYLVGEGVAMLVTRALPEGQRNDDTIRTCIRFYREDYAQNWNVRTKPYDGVPEMLDTLTARGLKMAVLSNKPDDFTKQCVSEYLPKWKFDVVFGQRNSIPQKPDPSGAKEVASHLNILPEKFLYLGDTSVDMKTAVAAGMFPVGALWGFRSADELLANGAQALIEKPREIVNLLSLNFSNTLVF